ncbi:MAG: SDR family NAD(P)-dependent oxidoreductase [Gammaproteobacteria bacterium]|jgi:dehydrogenase/reductase SDR family protein 1
MVDLRGHVAVVTGGSKGIGKGIAQGLGEAGMTVYVTGRSTERAASGYGGGAAAGLTIEATARSVDAFGGRGIPCRVDHNNDADVAALFRRVADEQGRLDVLVNNAYQIPDPPVFGGGFWEHPVGLWDTQCGVGLRGYYVASVYAAPLMVAARRGLIVNISSRGGRGYVFSASYGVGKAGVDRMAQDMAHELRSYGVAALSLSPSKVKTEFVLEQVALGNMTLDPTEAQSVRLSGRVIAALAADRDLMSRSGSILTVAEVAHHYGVVDPDAESRR